MFSFSPRTLAILSVGTVGALGFSSGAFGTFSPTLLSGYTCGAYGYFVGFGYGYDCTQNVGGGGGGGGGGGSVVVTSPATPVIPTTPTTPTNPVIPNPTPTVDMNSDTDVVPTRTPLVIVASDIDNDPNKEAIQSLIQHGIMFNAPRVNPQRFITRAEFMKVLALAHGYTPVDNPNKEFNDLPHNADLAQYVYFGVVNGWVNSRNANFRPNDIISQGEIDKLIAAVTGDADADTVAKPSGGVVRGKAASDIYEAFFAQN